MIGSAGLVCMRTWDVKSPYACVLLWLIGGSPRRFHRGKFARNVHVYAHAYMLCTYGVSRLGAHVTLVRGART